MSEFKFFGSIIGVTLGISLTLGCSDPHVKSIRELTAVSETENLVKDGAWFGRHTCKIARYGKSVFSYVMPNDTCPRRIRLYKTEDGKSWTQGAEIKVSRPPDLIVDSMGRVHLIGHRPFDNYDVTEGDIFHLAFDSCLDISGSFSYELVAPRTSETTYYLGSSIDHSNNIRVVYCSSFGFAKFHSLTSATLNITDGKWHHSVVADSMESRLCYPYVLSGACRDHIVAVEDQFDPELTSTGYPYRYGKVQYFWKPRNGEKWKTQVLFNLNDSLSKLDIASRILRVSDVYIDSNDTLHVLIRMNEIKSQLYGLGFPSFRLMHYQKHELDTLWSHSELPFDNIPQARFFESAGELFGIGMNIYSFKLEVFSMSSLKQVAASRRPEYFCFSPYLFVSNNRNCSLKGQDQLDLVLFNGSKPSAALGQVDVLGTN